MIRHRNLSTHTYDEAMVNEIVSAASLRYLPAFQVLARQMGALSDP
jgi:hypothetical protein